MRCLASLNLAYAKLTPMTIRETLSLKALELKPSVISCAADHDLGRLEAEILLGHVLKKDRVWLHAHDEQTIPSVKLKNFYKLVERRKKHEPIAYIVGQKEFYRLRFVVNKNVLIPRPESELLVELGTAMAKKQNAQVWDIGTGSGAIAISIAKEIAPQKVLASDSSQSALLIAKKNARINNVKNITFLKADLVTPRAAKMLSTPLIIVANLPYLPLSDKKKLAPDVVKFEPSSALFAPQNGLAVIKKLLEQVERVQTDFSTRKLARNDNDGDKLGNIISTERGSATEWRNLFESFSLFLEFDPPQTQNLKTFAKKLFPKAKIAIHKDLAKRNRVIEISFPQSSL